MPALPNELLTVSQQALVAVFAALTALLTFAVTVYRFRHEQLRKMPFDHLTMLREAAAGDDLIARCLKQETDVEIARQVFGVTLGPAAARYMFRLMETERFSKSTLRAAAQYAKTEDGVTRIYAGKMTRVFFLVDAAATLAILFVTFLLMWAAYQSKQHALMFVFEFIGLFFATIMSRQTAKEARALYCAREAGTLFIREYEPPRALSNAGGKPSRAAAATAEMQ